MLVWSSLCCPCDCVGLLLVVGGANIVWSDAGSLAIGAGVAEGEDISIYLASSGEFVKFYVLFSISYFILSCFLICLCVCGGTLSRAMAKTEDGNETKIETEQKLKRVFKTSSFASRIELD